MRILSGINCISTVCRIPYYYKLHYKKIISHCIFPAHFLVSFRYIMIYEPNAHQRRPTNSPGNPLRRQKDDSKPIRKSMRVLAVAVAVVAVQAWVGEGESRLSARPGLPGTWKRFPVLGVGVWECSVSRVDLRLH